MRLGRLSSLENQVWIALIVEIWNSANGVQPEAQYGGRYHWHDHFLWCIFISVTDSTTSFVPLRSSCLKQLQRCSRGMWEIQNNKSDVPVRGGLICKWWSEITVKQSKPHAKMIRQQPIHLPQSSKLIQKSSEFRQKDTQLRCIFFQPISFFNASWFFSTFPGFTLSLDLFLKDVQSSASIFNSDAIKIIHEDGKIEVEAVAGQSVSHSVSQSVNQ